LITEFFIGTWRNNGFDSYVPFCHRFWQWGIGFCDGSKTEHFSVFYDRPVWQKLEAKLIGRLHFACRSVRIRDSGALTIRG